MGVTILIVDDSKLARLVAAKAVGALQPEWTRLEAANAAEALQVTSTHEVDVVLVDYNMPGRNGLELAQDLRTKHPTMPIAVISANMQHEIIAAARGVNATFVGKPLTLEGLRPFLARASLRLQT